MYEECKIVLETFQNDKLPGEDGFTAEFFFELLSHHLIASFNEAYDELTISQRSGVITLIPKEDGSLLDSNWRAITQTKQYIKNFVWKNSLTKSVIETATNLLI